MGRRQAIRLVRAGLGFFDDNDSGSFDGNLLGFLEERCLPYIVVARMTQFI
jgi:hypothetical protein